MCMHANDHDGQEGRGPSGTTAEIKKICTDRTCVHTAPRLALSFSGESIYGVDQRTRPKYVSYKFEDLQLAQNLRNSRPQHDALLKGCVGAAN